MAGEKLASFNIGAGPITGPRIAVKEAVFPFSRFPGVDPLLGPEMRSTGEVMGLDVSFGAAYLKSQIAAGMALPDKGCVFISVREGDKAAIEQTAREIAELGFTIIATAGTAQFLAERGIKVERVNKVLEGEPQVVDGLRKRGVRFFVSRTELPMRFEPRPDVGLEWTASLTGSEATKTALGTEMVRWQKIERTNAEGSSALSVRFTRSDVAQPLAVELLYLQTW